MIIKQYYKNICQYHDVLCSRDEMWVMNQLVPKLEGAAPGRPRFRLCLHHRDFRPGTAILDNIEAAIFSARRTLCVVTRDFLRSEWCALEFQMASLRLLCEAKDVLLLVFLEDIPDHGLSAYTRLRKMVRRETYLRWPGAGGAGGSVVGGCDIEAFWVKLEEALRDNEWKEEEGEEGGDELARLLS